MFEEYELEVLKDYQEKRANGALLSNLMHPTPGNLKKECVIAFDRGYLKKDEIILRSFFDLKGDTETYRSAIKKWDREKFKRLNAVLIDSSTRTAEQNIELLAWLIDFEPRPYANWLKNGSVKTKNSEDVSGEIVEAEVLSVLEVEEPRGPVAFKKYILGIIAAVIVIAVGAYLLLNWPSVPGVQKCMYWTGDHYEPIACDKKPADTTAMVIGMDSNKMLHFKRITRADTLTAASVGKVWYININDDPEYYTAPGEPPAHPGRRLLLLTAHILDVHPRHPG